MNRIITSLVTISVCINISFAQVTKDAKALYDQGLKLKEENKSTEALEKFRQSISLNTNYTEALYQAGWCQNDLKNYSSAIDYLRKAREVWSLIPKVHFELGYAFEKSGITDSAIKTYNRCIDLKPDYANAYKQLGYIAYNNNDYALALLQFKKYEEAAASGISDYLYWYRKGYSKNALKDYNGAMVTLRKSLEYKPDYINTHLELGFAATKLELNDIALGHFKAAIEIDPKNYKPYNGIGEVYRDNKKDMNEAMAWYRKTLAINPMERKANFGMGYCFNSLLKYSEAIDHLKKAVEAEPNYTTAYVELGYSYFKSGKETDAVLQFNKAISLNPKNENARYYACQLYIKQKNKIMAQKMLNELKELSSRHVTTLQSKVDAL